MFSFFANKILKSNLSLLVLKVREWAPATSKARSTESEDNFYSDGEEAADEEESESSSEKSSGKCLTSLCNRFIFYYYI